jgi:hypothetical protein
VVIGYHLGSIIDIADTEPGEQQFVYLFSVLVGNEN